MSIYEERLQLLAMGYTSDIDIDNIPADIITHCASWMKEEPQISFTEWFKHIGTLPLELQLTGFPAKIINHQHIDKYIVKCVPDYNSKTITKEEERKVACCTISRIYNLNCLAFVGTRAFEVKYINNKFTFKLTAKVSVFDKQQRMICESPWKSFWNGPFRLGNDNLDEEYDDKNINKYFDGNIDINDKGFVDIDEWLIAMKKTEIVMEENKAKKMFYLICDMYKSDQSIVTAKMFRDFICDHSDYGWHGFNNEYLDFIASCREKLSQNQ